MMIKKLEVKNFKSIKHLKLDCKKVNIFIGKPNTGKSNILESIGIFSIPYGNIRDFIRFENMANLFHDHNLEEKIEIIADDIYCEMRFENGRFIGTGKGKKLEYREEDYDYIPGSREFDFRFDFDFGYEGNGGSGLPSHSGTSPFRFYRFAVVDKFPKQESNFLLPPKGENLLSTLFTNKVLRKVASDIFSEYEFKIVLKPQEKKIEIQKEIEDVIISHPYSLVSDTLQRIVFHLAAIETNKDSIIIFEEPEAHAFPFHTKFLAERISLDKTNQYFISTHNPYFLLSVLEKTPKDDIGIFITYFKDYQTKVRPILEKEMPEILDLDASIFFNLDKFLEEE